MPNVRRVAIACQGGGSHAAFAAGLLHRLLGAERRARFELVALSGTSGGAICAALAWRGLVASGPDEAAGRLRAFWTGLEVRGFIESVTNFWGVWFARFPVVVEVSPYSYEPIAETTLRALLSTHLELESLTPDPARRAHPKLLIGATDVLDGERVIFEGEALSYDDVIASAAVPPLFRAVDAEGRRCWDGLFTTNPPIREFTDLEEPPDEIWVIQINPQRRKAEPRTTSDIVDRRNELAGNLSLGQELFFLEKINELRAAHPSLATQYRHIQVRVVELAGAAPLDYPSKLDRRPELIEHLFALGQERAEWFFDARSEWPRPSSVPAHSVVASKPQRTAER